MEDLSTSNRIVVGVDGSVNAAAALSWALQEARARRAPLEAVYVWHRIQHLVRRPRLRPAQPGRCR